MENPLKKAYDYASLLNDIKERQDIVDRYIAFRYLDRNDAINKINSLQNTDVEMVLATRAKQSQSGSVNLSQAEDGVIISNIQFQIDFLKAKLAKKQSEDAQ